MLFRSTLNWTSSASTVSDAGAASLTTYTDSTVQAGQTYFYVATSVDSNNVESAFSDETSATIPTP